jgi:hypothetical protein
LVPVRGRITVCGLGALLAMALLAQSAAAANPVADYRFQDSFSSSVPGANDMQTAGTGDKFVTETVGCSPQRVLSFPQGSGVQVTNPNPEDGNYSIVADFRLSDLSGYRRIFDPSGYSSTTFGLDNGLYERDGALVIWDGSEPGNPFTGAPGALQPNIYKEVAFTFSGKKNSQEPGYVNGVKSLSSYVPADSDSLYAHIMRFFKDNDPPGASGENSAGAVSRIRIYNGVMTPDEVASVYASGRLAGDCNPLKRASATINGKVKVKRRHGRFIVLTGIDASCPAGGGACTGSAAVTRGGGTGRLAAASRLPKRLGKTKLSVAAGKSKAVKVKLTRQASNALRSKGKLKTKISVHLAPPGGDAAIASRTAKLKAPKPRHS